MARPVPGSRSPPAPHPRPGAAGARTPRGARTPARPRARRPPSPCAPAGAALPGEAELAVVAALADREHVGVGRAGEEQVPHLEGLQGPQTPALARAAEALQPAVALGPHPGGRAGAVGGEPRGCGSPRAVIGAASPGAAGAGSRPADAAATASPEGTAAPPGARAPPGGGGPGPAAPPRARDPRPRPPTRPTVGRCGHRPELRPPGRLQAGGRRRVRPGGGRGPRPRSGGRDGVAVGQVPSASPGPASRMARAGLIEVGGVGGQDASQPSVRFVCPCRKP